MSAFIAVLTAIKVAVIMCILADVVSISHVINSATADVADGSYVVVPLALDVAELQSLSLVASDA